MTMPEERITGGDPLPRNPMSPLPEALVRLPLPLTGEIVITDVSPCGNGGTCVLVRGDGWAMKNVSSQ